jgi:hypothetical protein
VKKCVKCKEFRILSDYCNNKYGIDGLSWICNDCKKNYALAHIKPVKCDCGRIINKHYLPKHLNSNIHNKYLNFSLQEKNND